MKVDTSTITAYYIDSHIDAVSVCTVQTFYTVAYMLDSLSLSLSLLSSNGIFINLNKDETYKINQITWILFMPF